MTIDRHDPGRGQSSPPFSLDEVHAAVRALRAGEFAHAGHHPARHLQFAAPPDDGPRPGLSTAARGRPPASSAGTGTGTGTGTGGGTGSWAPAPKEQVVVVVGSSGSSGASTLALAMGLTSPFSARIIECCSASASGLAAASTAELGLHTNGWLRGRREDVLIERASQIFSGVHDAPTPTCLPSNVTDGDDAWMTILDVGWEVGQIVTTDSWITNALAGAGQVVISASATVPGIRRLEGTLSLLNHHAGVHVDQVCIAVRGLASRTVPRGLLLTGGQRVKRAASHGKLVEIRQDRHLRLDGLDSRPLPSSLLDAATQLHSLNMSLAVDKAMTARSSGAPDSALSLADPANTHPASGTREERYWLLRKLTTATPAGCTTDPTGPDA